MASYQPTLYLFPLLKNALPHISRNGNGKLIYASHGRQFSRFATQGNRSVKYTQEKNINPFKQLSRLSTRSLSCNVQGQLQNGWQPARHFSQMDSKNLVYSPNPPVDIPDVSLGEFLMDSLGKYGSLEAMVDLPTGRRWTFQELRDDVVRVSSALTKLGIGKGEVVCVFTLNCPEYVILLVAIMNLGAVFSPINAAATAAELSGAFSLAKPSVVVTETILSETADQACAENGSVKTKINVGSADGWLPFSQLLEDDGLSFTEPVTLKPKEDLAIMPYSSGTTGFPKAVMLTHYNVLANMIQFSNMMPGKPGQDRALAYIPFSHVYGYANILFCLPNGATLNVIPRFTDKLLDIFSDEKITLLHLIPPICLFMMKHPNLKQYDLSPVRYALCSAAPMGKAHVDHFMETTGIELGQGYGMTEIGGVATVDFNPIRSGSVGRPLSGTVMKVIDVETKEILGAGQVGEICMRGPTVMAGYLGNQKATAETMQDDWMLTGDVGHYDSDSYFYITDRVKELIKYKGNQVAPAELEALLITHPAIQDAAVIGVPDEEAGELPRAYVVTKPGVSTDDLTAKDVIDFMSGQVAPYKKLRGGVKFVSQIPKSPSGKILKRMIKDDIQ